MSQLEENPSRPDVHPYVIKLDLKIDQLNRLLDRIVDIAECDLLLTDDRTGDAVFGMNLSFADKLDEVSQILSRTVATKAADLRKDIDKAIEHKVDIQDVLFFREILEPSELCQQLQERTTPPRRFIQSSEFRAKREVLSDEEDDIIDSVTREHRDGHFQYPKINENDPSVHSYVCQICQAVFRDINGIRNHDSQHKKEFYKCMKCLKTFRTIQGFEAHRSEHSTSHKCQVCGEYFALKTTLINHMQMHNEERLPCSHKGCDETFQHRQAQLNHIGWAHKELKTVPCNHCIKLFQTPNHMRSHRHYKHGHVPDITPGHPDFGLRTPLPEQRRIVKKNTPRKKRAKPTRVSKRKADETIPTALSGPLCSPPPQPVVPEHTSTPKPKPTPKPLVFTSPFPVTVDVHDSKMDDMNMDIDDEDLPDIVL